MDTSRDSDDEYVEEELLVYADFQSKIASSTLRDSANVKIIGMETGQPIMEIGDKIFRGNFEHAIGTMLFFDENPVPPASLENYETIPKTWYKYLCKTDRVMRMNRIFVDAKDTKNAGAAAATASNNASSTSSVKAEASDEASAVDQQVRSGEAASTALQHIPIERSYAQALDQLLKPGELPPRPPDMADEEFFRRFGTLEATLGGGGGGDDDTMILGQ